MTMPGGLPKRGHKYRAIRTECGHCAKPHPSKAEARRCTELHLLQSQGIIKGLECQPKFFFQVNGETVKHPNGRRAVFTPDWRYVEGDKSIVEDCKGMRTADYVTRIAFFRAFYPYLTLIETGK